LPFSIDFDRRPYNTLALPGVSCDLRDADDEVHLGLVGDAGQLCAHAVTLGSSTCLIESSRRNVEAAKRAVVEKPTGRTRT